MARYLTEAELQRFASNLSLNEQVTLKKYAAERSLSGSTFLSHSSSDAHLVVGAIHVLETHGAKVYIDKVDPQLPPYTTEETADLLKQRIQQTKRFVLLASKNSKESRWVPWELGIADGEKGLEQIALFPASGYEHESSWANWEYLGLYRRIAVGRLEGHDGDVYMVLDEKRNTATELRKWLAG